MCVCFKIWSQNHIKRMDPSSFTSQHLFLFFININYVNKIYCPYLTYCFIIAAFLFNLLLVLPSPKEVLQLDLSNKLLTGEGHLIEYNTFGMFQNLSLSFLYPNLMFLCIFICDHLLRDWLRLTKTTRLLYKSEYVSLSCSQNHYCYVFFFFFVNYFRCFLAKKYKYILRKFKTVKQTLKLSSRIYLLILLIRYSQYNFNLSFLGNLLSTLCSVSKEVVYWLDNK